MEIQGIFMKMQVGLGCLGKNCFVQGGLFVKKNCWLEIRLGGEYSYVFIEFYKKIGSKIGNIAWGIFEVSIESELETFKSSNE